MKYISKTNIVTLNGKTWWVIAKRKGVYTVLLKNMINQLENIMTHHSKIMLIRFDLRQPTFTENNKRITVFNRRLFKWLKSKYGFLRIGFIWCREQELSEAQHYHYVLLLDGHKIKHPCLVLDKVKSIWETMNGTYWGVKNCFYRLTRYDDLTLQRAIFRVSYLAKASGKNRRPTQTKDFGMSRIKYRL